MDLHNIRRDYQRAELTQQQLASDPNQQFDRWMAEAIAAYTDGDPTAMTLATVDADHNPHQRVVLLKANDASGFYFYTNLGSQKAQDIGDNHRVSLHFSWLSMERQISIRGHAQPVDRERVATYFHSRPRASQIAALASQQSQPIASREQLMQRYQQLQEKYANTEQPIPLPDSWGGFCVEPHYFEFWQGGSHRLHDRFCYRRSADGWTIQRLQP